MPSLKQEKTFKDLMVNNGKSVAQAMRDNGYDPRTANNSHQLTKSKGWKELTEKYLPDQLLLRTNKNILRAKKYNEKLNKYEPDFMAQARGLELGYKAKGRFIETATQFNMGDLQIKVVSEEAPKPINET